MKAEKEDRYAGRREERKGGKEGSREGRKIKEKSQCYR